MLSVDGLHEQHVQSGIERRWDFLALGTLCNVDRLLLLVRVLSEMAMQVQKTRM